MRGRGGRSAAACMATIGLLVAFLLMPVVAVGQAESPDHRAEVRLGGQNGKRVDLDARVKTPCAKRAAKKAGRGKR
jgi:hypothetical protein